MRKIYPTIVAIGLFALFVGTACKAAHAQLRLKVVEQYEINAGEYQVNPKTAPRRIVNLYFYNAAEKVAERWDFSGNYYRRHVFNYDRKGRMTADLVNESVHLAENRYFTVERSRSGIKVVPAVGETVAEITITEYNGRGDTIEERITDGEGVLKRKVTREFDSFGSQTLLREVDGSGNLIGNEYRRTCGADGRRCENVWKAEDGSTIKGIALNDEKHRLVLEETYRSSVETSKVDHPVLTGRSIWSYKGDLTNLDWYLYKDDGTPTERLMIVDKGDREISRKTFTASINQDGSVNWLPESEELRECTFDKGGECILEIWKERRSGENVYKFTLVQERIESWY